MNETLIRIALNKLLLKINELEERVSELGMKNDNSNTKDNHSPVFHSLTKEENPSKNIDYKLDNAVSMVIRHYHTDPPQRYGGTS